MSTGKSENPFETYLSREVLIGQLKLGGLHPVRIQSMTNTDTNDIISSVAQCEELILAGSELVRLTTQGKREVKSIAAIRNTLRDNGKSSPLVADIHFTPGLAEEAAAVVEKIRINPGNYLNRNNNDDAANQQALTQLTKLTDICKTHQTAIRIGVNHGSLSERILRKYGNTPAGMVESALEFIRICVKLDFHNLIISLKSSNTKVMIQSVRLLVSKMMREGLNYPIHLGVTEAGDGMYGRIKSTVGSAPLLLEGMGDTIRVSLTEQPVNEIPVAKTITELFNKPSVLPYNPFTGLAWDSFFFHRRVSAPVIGIGGGRPVSVITNHPGRQSVDPDPSGLYPICIPFSSWKNDRFNTFPTGNILLVEHGSESIQEIKYRVSEFCINNQSAPIIYKRISVEPDLEKFQIKLAGELGFLLVDGAIDAVWVENKHFSVSEIYDLLLLILQASGTRISQTEYIACPSCGRTHFDIESRLQEIKRGTSHLKHLKIGVMGCIVNGPGEMADADYGYVGASKGMVSIYKERQSVIKNIPEKEALKSMIDLIKEHGDWIDP